METHVLGIDLKINNYKEYIQNRNGLGYVAVYSNEIITVTNTKRRVGFNKMIADALEGKINLIITKSISRFSRNTLDTISFVRKLKDKSVEVYFEKENLLIMKYQMKKLLR